MIYTGIGSRQTPEEVCDLFRRMGAFLGKKGLVLRSGHADGADMAFEIGCDSVGGAKEIYLPWKGFNGSDSSLVIFNYKAYELAAKFHPAFDYLGYGPKKLIARDGFQILGPKLDTMTDFVVCYTQNGELKGGTAQAIRIASAYNIPVFNAGLYKVEDIKNEFTAFVEPFLKSMG